MKIAANFSDNYGYFDTQNDDVLHEKEGINEIKLPLVIIIKVKSPILVGDNHNDYDSAGKGNDLYI